MKMEEWKEYKLGEILAEKGYIRGPFGSALKRGDMKSSGIPVYEQQHAIYQSRDFRFFIDDNKFNEMKRFQVQENDILISCSGTVGKVTIISKDDPKGIISQALLTLRVNPKLILPEYLKFFFSSQKGYNAIISRSSGSVQVNIAKRDVIEQIPINLPPLPIQQKIVEILSSLDDKIELNNKINTNLEQQAQALFKNWFVDFEPFGGKMPEGWKVGKLSDIADYLNGLAMQKFRPLEGEEGLPVLKIKELRQGCCDESSELCLPSKVKSEYIIHDGDVIFSWSGSLLVDIWCGGTCGLNQHLFKVTSQTHEKWFYYLWTKHHLDRFIFLAADKATTMGHIKREELDKAVVIIPDNKTYSKSTMTLSPIVDTIINNRVENRRLSEIRDNLLPELMSGNISVEELQYE